MSHPDETKTIALVMYQGLTDLDLIGPLQVLSRFAQIDPRFEVAVVSERIEAIRSDSGISFLPEKTFAEIPHPYALVVPGGGVPTLRAMNDPAIRKYVAQAANAAEAVISVCTGSLILAAVGLLKGRSVPTHWAFARYLERFEARYVRERWVAFDKFIVTAGVSAGIDGALVLVARLAGEETARLVQASIEYDPEPPAPIEYSYRSVLARIMLTAIALMRPIYTGRARKLLRSGL